MSAVKEGFVHSRCIFGKVGYDVSYVTHILYGILYVVLRVRCLLKTVLSNHVTDSFNTHCSVYRDITRLMYVNFSLVLTR